MSVADTADRQLTFKLVYCGAVASGKRANLDALERLVADKHRGARMPLAGAENRTPFFDMLPIFCRIGDLGVRFQIFAVPGKAASRMTRRAVLQGADGVVFVADSSPSQASKNKQAFLELEGELTRGDVKTTPFVTQFNKRDIGDALPVSAFAGESVYEASTASGRGVAETFLGLAEQIWEADRKHLDLLPDEVSASQFREALAKHLVNP